jgi:hypothetical protein
LVVGSFDEAAFVEVGAGADEGDEVGCVDGAPAALGRLNELERHGDAGSAGAGSLGDPLAEPDRGEGGLD